MEPYPRDTGYKEENSLQMARFLNSGKKLKNPEETHIRTGERGKAL